MTLLYSVCSAWFIAYRLLQGSDTKNSHVVYGQDVEIFASRASCISQPTTGSSKVGLTGSVLAVGIFLPLVSHSDKENTGFFFVFFVMDFHILPSVLQDCLLN